MYVFGHVKEAQVAAHFEDASEGERIWRHALIFHASKASQSIVIALQPGIAGDQRVPSQHIPAGKPIERFLRIIDGTTSGVHAKERILDAKIVTDIGACPHDLREGCSGLGQIWEDPA
jgi:hypothetical protein